MSHEGFYNSKEKFIQRSGRFGVKPRKINKETTKSDRIRRTKNRGFRRLFHLAKKESSRKFLIGLFLVVTLILLLFSWFYSF
jgi:hypothetical protein